MEATAQDTRTVERQRSSSLSDAWRTMGRAVSQQGEMLPPPLASRRRSSGGVSAMSSRAGLGALVREKSGRSSYRASPIPGSSQLGLPALPSLESYSKKNVAAALESGMEQLDDEWQQVVVRVLPLFNGEGIRGFVEDLNELVLSHVQRTFARYLTSSRSRQTSLDSRSFVTGLLAAEVGELIRLGCGTLAAKLSPPSPGLPLSDERLLSRVNEIWLFFFTGILPHLEGVFWVLRCDQRLRAATGDTSQERERQGRTGRAEGRIDIRRMALIEFRDSIVHPEFERLVTLFAELYRQPSMPGTREPSPQPETPIPLPPDFRRSRSQPQRQSSHSLSTSNFTAQPPNHPQRQHSSPSRLSPDPNYIASFASTGNPTLQSPRFSSALNSPSPSSLNSPAPSTAPSPSFSPASAATAQAIARRRQMVGILASLLTEDDRQGEMDTLLRLMRPAHSGGRYGQRALRSTMASPEPMEGRGSDEDDGDDGDDGPGTGLTASPSMIDDHALDSPALQQYSDVDHQHPSSPHPVSPIVTHSIDVRQRSRTMESLDEEDGTDGFVLLNPGRPSPLARYSTDGSTPTASMLGAELGEEKKQKRQRSFLPKIRRSNSQQSTATGTGGESTGTEDDVPSSPGLGAPPAGGASAVPSLRRGILRRNSSRKAADYAVSMGGALGAASALTIDDEEYES